MARMTCSKVLTSSFQTITAHSGSSKDSDSGLSVGWAGASTVWLTPPSCPRNGTAQGFSVPSTHMAKNCDPPP